MTDNQILESLQKVLDDIHNSKKGIFRHCGKFAKGLLRARLAITKMIPVKDVRFNITGQESYEQRFGDLLSCTGMTKVFLYAARNSGLDLKAVITTDVEKGKKFTSDISKDDLDMWTFSYVVPMCPDDF